MATMENAGTTWLKDELEFLMENWDGRKTTTEVVAELLGRTVKACEERAYAFFGGRTEGAFTKAFPDFTKTRYASSAYKAASKVELQYGATCPSCFTTMPLTGTCDYCS